MNDPKTTLPNPPATGAESLDRVDELLSLFFDDCLDEAQLAELNEVLLNDPAARARCFDTAQLHADLQSFFQQPEGEPKSPAATPLAGLPLSAFGEGAPAT